MKILISFFLLISSISSFAMNAFSTNKIKDVEAKALELAKKYGASKVLVALDIDNTTLTMPHDFGSDQWFSWQYDGCIKSKNLNNLCITSDMGELLEIQGQLFSITNMIPSEPTTVEVVTNLQKQGLKVILLTSRGPEFRNATERSLKQNRLHFVESAIGPKNGYASTYIPFDTKNLNAFGLNVEDVKTAQLSGKGRPVSYMDGVFMTSGQNKGIMLKTLIHKTKANVKAVVFADDHEKHTTRMQAILGRKDSKLELFTYRYGAIDENVKAFLESKDRQNLTFSKWTELKNTTQTIFK